MEPAPSAPHAESTARDQPASDRPANDQTATASSAAEPSTPDLRTDLCDFFAVCFEASPDAVMVVDDERRCVRANAAGALLFGLSQPDLVGRPIDAFVRAELGPLVDAAWQRFLAEGAQSGEVSILRPDGTVRRAEFRSRARVAPGWHLAVLREVGAPRVTGAQVGELIARSRAAAAEAQRVTKWLAQLHDFARTLEPLSDLEAVSAATLEWVGGLGCSAAALLLPAEAPGAPRRLLAARGLDPELLRTLGEAQPETRLGQYLFEPRATGFPDASQAVGVEPAFALDAARGRRAWAFAPLRTAGAPGILVLGFPEPVRFDHPLLEVLGLVGALAARALSPRGEPGR